MVSESCGCVCVCVCARARADGRVGLEGLRQRRRPLVVDAIPFEVDARDGRVGLEELRQRSRPTRRVVHSTFHSADSLVFEVDARNGAPVSLSVRAS